MTSDARPVTEPWDGYATSLIEIGWPGHPLLISPDAHPGTATAAPLGSLAVVSACNPASSRRSPRENRQATRTLKRRLVDLGLEHLEAVGYSPGRDWIEPSFAVVDAAATVAQALCREFGQIAYFAVDRDRVRVVDDSGRTRSWRPATFQPVHPESSVLAGLRSWFAS